MLALIMSNSHRAASAQLQHLVHECFVCVCTDLVSQCVKRCDICQDENTV